MLILPLLLTKHSDVHTYIMTLTLIIITHAKKPQPTYYLVRRIFNNGHDLIKLNKNSQLLDWKSVYDLSYNNDTKHIGTLYTHKTVYVCV